MASKRHLPRWLLVFLILFLTAGLYELYRVIMPFESNNPLWHEVTIGEPVIDDWKYEGYDEEGYLRFNSPSHGGSIVLPPSQHTFDADGKFVVLEGSTPSSLTFAQPYEAIPLRWWLIAGCIISPFVFVIWLRLQSRRRGFRRRRPRRSLPVNKLQLHVPTSTRRRFRPHKR